jgi:hypothetical protein
MSEKLSYLQRGKGKVKGNVKKNDFYKFYLENAKEKVIDRITYNAFLKEVIETFSNAIVTTGLELKINSVGKIRVRTQRLNFFKKDGVKSKSLRVDWHKTWAHWHNKYPGLSRQEITEVPDKTLIYHENEHSNQEFYEHHWDKLTTSLKFKNFYKFKPSRQYSRLIAKVVKDPNRKTFYYG